MNCPYCDKTMHTKHPPERPRGMKRADFRPIIAAWHRDAKTRDHIVAQSRGGKNWVYACGQCNSDKRDLSLFEWRVLMSIRQRRLVLFAFERAALRHLFTSLLCTLSRVRFA